MPGHDEETDPDRQRQAGDTGCGHQQGRAGGKPTTARMPERLGGIERQRRIPGQWVIRESAEKGEVDRHCGQRQGDEQARALGLAQQIAADEAGQGQNRGMAEQQQTAGQVVALAPALEQIGHECGDDHETAESAQQQRQAQAGTSGRAGRGGP